MLVYSLVFLESGGSGGDEHLDHNNDSGLVSSEIGVEHRLPPLLRQGWGKTLVITSAKRVSKSSAKNTAKTSQIFLEI